MPCCCVKNCNNRSETSAKGKDGVSFHLFPRNAIKRQKWINAIGRKGWTPTATTVVCSRHFSENCFYKTKSGLIRLLNDAVPFVYTNTNEVRLSKEDKKNYGEDIPMEENDSKDTKLTVADFPVLKVPILDASATEKDRILAAHIKRMLFMCKRQRKAIREVQKLLRIQEDTLNSFATEHYIENSNLNVENCEKHSDIKTRS